MELDCKTATGLDCSPCWKNTPRNNVYFTCQTRNSEKCLTCLRNCSVVRQCEICPFLGKNGSGESGGNGGSDCGGHENSGHVFVFICSPQKKQKFFWRFHL